MANKRVALVTGSATGIGANIAVDLATTGDYLVIITGRDAISMQRVVAQCNRAAVIGSDNENQANVMEDDGLDSAHNDRELNQTVYAFGADLNDDRQVDNLIEFITSKFKRLDVLVNNACWRGQYNDPISSNDAFGDFKQVIRLNVSVPMYLIHKCLIPLAKKRKNPPSTIAIDAQPELVVINISSIASQIVVPLHSYSISKACLSELSKQLSESARELAISSIAISPGPVLTVERPHHQTMSNLTLMNRVGTTQEISNLVLFAINNAQLFNGKELTIDGGYVSKQKLVSDQADTIYRHDNSTPTNM